MARILLEEIQNTLAPLGWSVVSPKYDRLDDEMIFKCPEGHEVYSTWRKIRTKAECPICAATAWRANGTVISKKKNTFRVLGLDQATHTTGFAIMDNGELQKYGIFEAKDNGEPARLVEIRNWFLSMIELWQPDYIEIEGIQFQEQVGGARMGVVVFSTLSHLQGVLIETAKELDIPLDVVPTNTWRAHCHVKGRSRADKKASMRAIVKSTYDVTVTDDCADAIGIAKYCADTKTTKTEMFKWGE